MAKVYAKRRVQIDIDNDGEKEECTAFLLSGSFVIKLRKRPPNRMIQEWRKTDIKPGVTANVAILKPAHAGPEGGRTVLTSIWYDLANLKEVHEDTLELIYSMLKEVPEDKMTEEQKRALEYIERRLDEKIEKIVLTQKLSVEGKKQVWVCVLPYGEFHDPRYGKVKITREMCEQMVKNFKSGIPHYEPPINISHKDEMGAFGVVRDLEVREDGLWALLELTAEGAELVEKERFRYLSAEFAEHYTDKRTGKDVGFVFLGVALTNRPAHPGMRPLELEEGETMEEEVVKLTVPDDPPESWPLDEDSSWDWDWARDADEIVEKFGWATLAKACGYVNTKDYDKGPSGYPEVKEAYKLPFAKVKNGKMTIFWSGVRAAMAALLGARGGVKIPDEEKKRVYNKLARLYERFGKEPPEFHLEEDEERKVFEERIAKLEEELKEKTAKLKEYEEEIAKLKKALWEKEVTLWAEAWKDKGVAPAVVEKFAKKLMERPELKEDFDAILSDLANPVLLKRLSDHNTVSDADVLRKFEEAVIREFRKLKGEEG